MNEFHKFLRSRIPQRTHPRLSITECEGFSAHKSVEETISFCHNTVNLQFKCRKNRLGFHATNHSCIYAIFNANCVTWFLTCATMSNFPFRIFFIFSPLNRRTSHARNHKKKNRNNLWRKKEKNQTRAKFTEKKIDKKKMERQR